MADNDLLQDDYVGDLDMDDNEEDALLDKGFENRHSIFLDRDGEKVHRYHFDDEEEEDILDIGLTEDLGLTESDQLADYSNLISESSQRTAEKNETTISNFPKQTNQGASASATSNVVAETGLTENVSSSTSGSEEFSAHSGKGAAPGPAKIVISSKNSKGPVVRPNLQIFTKELRNRREQGSNIRKRLGAPYRQPNVRLRHPHPRFMNPNMQGNERMMGPSSHFRPPGLHFRPGGPPRQMGHPPRPMGSPIRQLGPPMRPMGSPHRQLGPPPLMGSPHRQMGPSQHPGGPPQTRGVWPKKILINPHFNQNNQNKGPQQSWVSQNQPPAPQQWQTPPTQNQQFNPPFQPQMQQQPHFRPNAPPPMNPHQTPSTISMEQSPPAPHYMNQPHNYQPDYNGYGDQSLPQNQFPPPNPGPPPQTPPYQQNYYNEPLYPDTRPPPPQSQMVRAPHGYEMQTQSHYEPPREPHQQPPPIGPPDVEIIPQEPYIEHPSPRQTYPPPSQTPYYERPQYSSQSYEETQHFNDPPMGPPSSHYGSPNPSFRQDLNCGPLPPRQVTNQPYGSEPNPQNYSYSEGPPTRNIPYNEQPPVGQCNEPVSGPSGYIPLQSEPTHEPQNQFRYSQPPVNLEFGSSQQPPQEALYPGRGSIKSRLGARVPNSPLTNTKGQVNQIPQQGSSSFSNKKNIKRNLNTLQPGATSSLAAKQPRFDQSSPKRVAQRNLHEVQTVSNLPDTTTFCEKEAVVKVSNEMNEICLSRTIKTEAGCASDCRIDNVPPYLEYEQHWVTRMEIPEEEDEEMREYRKRIEAQQQFRKKIFQIKEARRKHAVLQQSQTSAKGNSDASNSSTASSESITPETVRTVQPIATIVNRGATGKRNVQSAQKKQGQTLKITRTVLNSSSNDSLQQRALRFGGQDQSSAEAQNQKQGKIRIRIPREIVNVNEPLKHFNVDMIDGRIVVRSKTAEERQRAVILPDTTQTQQSSASASSGDFNLVQARFSESLKTATASSQPRTLDERFSGLKSGVLVQPKEEKFASNSNRTVLPASESNTPLDPNASSIVIVDNLSASTKAQQLVDIASRCGKLGELNLKQSMKQAILKFKTPAGAAEFFKRYQRKMIDLSMISLTMGPPTES